MTRARTQALAEQVLGHGHHVQLIVDVYLLLVREDKILLGRRSNTGYGDGAYEPPSGRLSERETIVEAAVRVAAAQAGVELLPSAISLAHVMHDVSGSGRIAFFLAAQDWHGEPSDADAAAEYSDLGWFSLEGLPASMIDRSRVAVRNYAAGARFSTYPAFELLAPLWPGRVGGRRPGKLASTMELVKAHGSRNEIFVAGARPDAFPAAGALREFVRHVCDRRSWTGGGDGVYFYDAGPARTQAWFFNPDGSAAEFCGNGMRVLGRHVMDLRGSSTETITSGSVDYTVRRGATVGGVAQVEVELPPVTFAQEPPVPFDGYTAVSVPNPHVVTIVPGYSERDLIAAGTLAPDVFPDGANVSFLLELGPDEIFVRTFERGAGLTPSCGSGIIASRAVYSRSTGVDPQRRILVRNVGGVARAAMRVADGRWFGVLEGNATVVYRAQADMSGAEAGAREYARDEIDAFAALDAENAGSLAAAGVELGTQAA